MMYEKRGDIFQVESGIIMHGCNCYGVMGAGVAKLVKEKYPTAYDDYVDVCEDIHVRHPKELLGLVHMPDVSPTLHIANCFTQIAPGAHAEIAAIRSCLQEVLAFAEESNLNVHSVQIGCGIGGLSWSEVSKVYREECALFPTVNMVVWSL